MELNALHTALSCVVLRAVTMRHIVSIEMRGSRSDAYYCELINAFDILHNQVVSFSSQKKHLHYKRCNKL